jgi:NADPH oxidase
MAILGAAKHQLWGSKLVFNFLFHGGHIALFAFGWLVFPGISCLVRSHANGDERWKQFHDPRLAGLNTLTFSVWISRSAGLALSVDGAMILLPMCRNILRWVRPKVRFLPLDESQWFHRQVAYSMLFWTIVHVCGHYVK